MSLGKADFLAMDEDMRAFALVGAFMGHFALLETGINSALSTVLSLGGAGAAIVTRNMSFDDKIKTLRALVATYVLDQAKAKEFDTLAKRARRFGETRNVIAHTPFRRSERSDGVEFFVVSASSSLQFPDMDWPVDEFLARIDEINKLDEGLRSIETALSIDRIADALLQHEIKNESPKPGGLLELGKLLMNGEL